MDAANNGEANLNDGQGLGLFAATSETTYEVLKGMHARGIKEKKRYIDAIAKLKKEDLPRSFNGAKAVDFAVGELSASTTDDKREALAKLMREGKFSDATVTVSMIRDIVKFMVNCEDGVQHKEDDDGSESSSDEDGKKKRKSKRGEDSEEEEDPLECMIGTRLAPELKKAAHDLFGDKPKYAHKSVYDAAQVVINKTQTCREMGSKIYALGVGPMTSKFVAQDGFPLIWEFLQEVMRAAMVELLKLNGTEVHPDEFKKATADDEWASVAYKAAKITGKRMNAQHRLRNHIGRGMRRDASAANAQLRRGLKVPPPQLPPPPPRATQPAPVLPKAAPLPVPATPPPLSRCFNCGQTGHTKDVCTNPPKCYNCNATGHISTSCPQPKRQKLVKF